jgi:peroxiredoxin family protein
MADNPLGVLLISGTHERAHYAFSLVCAAAALGRPAILFATNAGCRAMMADWQSLEDAGRDAVIQCRGVAGLDTLRAAAGELGVRLMVCETGLVAEALEAGALLGEVQVSGLATFLHAMGPGQIISL